MYHIYTIGHSTRSLEEFVDLLRENDIHILANVRTWPHSERYPQFNRDNLEEDLKKRRIRYEWLGKELGGFRKKGLGDKSPNKAWKNQSFRNYADHTMTDEFRKGITKRSKALLPSCVQSSCHRQIISDYLKVQGRGVTHIIGKGKTEEHELTSFGKWMET